MLKIVTNIRNFIFDLNIKRERCCNGFRYKI